MPTFSHNFYQLKVFSILILDRAVVLTKVCQDGISDDQGGDNSVFILLSNDLVMLAGCIDGVIFIFPDNPAGRGHR